MKQKTRKRVGAQIVESLAEFVEALQAGADLESFTCRRIEVAVEKPVYVGETVRQTRKLMQASQAVFAHFLGVSLQTVRAWEQGENVPSDIAKRFMDEIRHDPEYWRSRLREVVRPKKPAAAIVT